jgi:hypothetical protein
LTVRPDSPIAVRARLSLAGNDYLQAARGGCEQPGQGARDLLLHAGDTLRAIAADTTLPELARFKAKVDFAQVEQCRESAGETADSSAVNLFLAEIAADPVTPGADAEIREQIKAFALSVAATRRARTGDRAGAVELIDGALAHEARFERNALWEGLKFAWLLYDCRLDEARTARDRSLEQLHLAVEHGRLPAELERRDSDTFAADLAAAESRCAAMEEP